MKLIILLCVVAGAFASQCGQNQHYNSCGTACPLTCDNYDDPPKVCVLMCNPGCHCDAGYVKTADGKCVKPEECPAKSEQVCGLNERYTKCGTACPLTCENYRNPPKLCNKMCYIGCECEEGYVRATRGGRCVKSFQCPQDAAVHKLCIGKPDTGMCDAYIPSWNYDIETGVCHRFIYGGCGGNGNRFATEEECMNYCAYVNTWKHETEACDLPAETGVCRGSFPRYYFDRITGQCQKFVYGGCGGNDNNFETLEDCQQTCDVQVCDLPAETGLCRGSFPRYYFDKTSGQCQQFIYGGCGGNGNNFKSIEECQSICA